MIIRDMKLIMQMSFFPCEERQLDALIKQMWDIEEPQSRILVRPQDEEAEETVSATQTNY